MLLLPYLDEPLLYAEYRFDEPWDGPRNSKLADRTPATYRCPSFGKSLAHHDLETKHSLRMTNYVAISAKGAVFDGPQATPIKDIHDGTSNTIVIAEVRQHAVHWMQPDDVTPNELLTDLQYATQDEHANHFGGLHVLLADGAVRFLPSKSSLKRLQALISRDGGESVEDF